MDLVANLSDFSIADFSNFTILEDFQVFDSRDLMNVLVYAAMSLGELS